MRLNRAQDAIESLRKSREASGTWKSADAALLELAKASREVGDLEGAITTLRQLFEAFPKSKVLDNAHLMLGEYYQSSEQYAAAVKQYRVLSLH